VGWINDDQSAKVQELNPGTLRERGQNMPKSIARKRVSKRVGKSRASVKPRKAPAKKGRRSDPGAGPGRRSATGRSRPAGSRARRGGTSEADGVSAGIPLGERHE